MTRTLISTTSTKIGKEITVKGWVNSVRKHGKITFFDLRDHTGLLQIVTDKSVEIKPEYVLSVSGKVIARPAKLINSKLSTGAVEMQTTDIKILATSKEMPFPIDTDGSEIGEEVRLKYRYLDLRRPRMQENLRLRSQYVKAIREYLFDQSFTEIETPLLTKSTPEGSRDFVVPSRHYPGKFYALPQSPQQYKQLLMASGFEKYFQLARCLRDEDPRADRAYEHTQVDLELSFVEQRDVMDTVENMVIYALKKVGYGDKIVNTPFPVITYEEAMKKYGADKFDLRSEEEKSKDMLSFAWVIRFPFFEKTEEGNWTFTHNPFSSPLSEHKQWHLDKTNIDQIITQQYDLVCNGHEVGGGSIRAHQADVLRSTFEIMGYSQEEINTKFGHMLEAFSYGTPPHGGCAHGVERMIMLMKGEEYIREVQAFPMTGRGRTSVMDAPSTLDTEQLDDLKLQIKSDKIIKNGEEAFAEIINRLKKAKIHDFEQFEHLPVFTSEDAAKIRDTKIEQGAKALVMMANSKPIMVVLSGSNTADFSAFKKLFQIKDLRMATKDEVKELTNLEVGSIPPFGSLFKFTTYVDEKLGKNSQIVFNAGLHTKSIKMNYTDWLKVENPTVGNFSK